MAPTSFCIFLQILYIPDTNSPNTDKRLARGAAPVDGQSAFDTDQQASPLECIDADTDQSSAAIFLVRQCLKLLAGATIRWDTRTV
jgi:hypothetical protein